jgi:hypothetical protein
MTWRLKNAPCSARVGLACHMRITLSMKTRNYLNRHGEPICSICGRLILPLDSVVRVDDCMVHAYCADVAQEALDKGEEPCTPTVT